MVGEEEEELTLGSQRFFKGRSDRDLADDNSSPGAKQTVFSLTGSCNG